MNFQVGGALSQGDSDGVEQSKWDRRERGEMETSSEPSAVDQVEECYVSERMRREQWKRAVERRHFKGERTGSSASKERERALRRIVPRKF